MTKKDIPRIRLQSHGLSASGFTKPEEVVGSMVAMQSQDFAMSHWAIACRMCEPSWDLIQNALNKGTLLRTHLLRPTWHLVSAKDIHWLLALTAPRIKMRMKTMDRQLGLDQKILNKCNRIIEKALGGISHLSRDKLIESLRTARVVVAENRAAHIFMAAELEGLIASGPLVKGRQSYALLSQRVREGKVLDKDESLGLLASRYFSGHGPATVADFSWWSGLPLTSAKKGIDIAGGVLHQAVVDKQTYWFDPAFEEIT